jgi:hypothetical protein
MRVAAVLAAVLLTAAGRAAASTVLGLSIEDQARLSRYVVMGEVLSQKGVEDEASGLETEVTLKVRSVFKGDVRRGDTVVFHTRSGEVGLESSTAIGEAEFRTGQKTLVFIEDVDGRLYNLGLSMGVWDVQVDRQGRQRFTRALRDGLEVVGDVEIERGPIEKDLMKRRVRKAVLQPAFDNPMLRERVQDRDQEQDQEVER